MIHLHREIDGIGPAHCSGIYGADESSAPCDLRKLARVTGSDGPSEPTARLSPSGERGESAVPVTHRHREHGTVSFED